MTPTKWGFEEKICDNGKKLFVKSQHQTGMLKNDKAEDLVILQGVVCVEMGATADALISIWIQDEEKIRIPENFLYRMTALRDSILIGFAPYQDLKTEKMTLGERIDDTVFAGFRADFIKSEYDDPILDIDIAKSIADTLRKEGNTIGMCNGTFDVLHPGHIEMLRQAKLRSNFLFVGIRTDEAVRKIKPDGSPFFSLQERCIMVAATKFADYVVPVNSTACFELIDAIRPDIYVTSTDGAKSAEAREVVKQGGKIDVVELLPGYSSSLVVQSILAKAKRK